MWYRYHIYIFLSSFCLLTSCLHVRHGQKDEYLLTAQCTVGNEGITNEELEPYYLQPTNRKVLGFPFNLWLYDLGTFFFDRRAIERDYRRIERIYNKKLTTITDPVLYQKTQEEKQKRLAFYEYKLKNGNFLMQRGESPVIYDPDKRAATEKNFLQYLHSKGYFNANVSSRVATRHDKVKVIYLIKENDPFILHTINLHSADSSLYQYLEPYAENSLLKKRQRYDQDVLIAERERIYNVLLEYGYWSFNKQYISFNVDTTSNNVGIETMILLPDEQKEHKKYNLENIEFTVIPRAGEVVNDTTLLEKGILFRNTQPHFLPSTIIDKITIQQGEVYSKSNILETRKRLASLGIFKDIHINHDLGADQSLRTYIRAQLYDKFQIEQEIGTEFTRITTLPFYQVALKSKNLLGRLEILSIKSQISVEVGALPTDGQPVKFLQNFQINATGMVQQFLLPLVRNWRKKLNNYYPHTKADLGYYFTTQANYNSRRFTSLLSYGWSPWPTTTFNFIPIKVSWVDFKTKQAFSADLEQRRKQGDFAYKRYQPALYNQLILETIFQTASSTEFSTNKRSTYLEMLIESSGAIQSLIDFKKIFGEKFIYYRYLKLSIVHSKHIPIRASTLLAYHIQTGILYPYNQYKIAPPEQYFFIGGPNSMRAWPSRGLGPGSYTPSLNNNKDKKFIDERPGELILQANLEIRQQLIGVLEGAVFIDLGNVWVLQKTKRLGEDFQFNRFYKEIAVGTGVGVALNFNFIVLRLDLGIKLYDPAMSLGNRLFPPTMLLPTINFSLGNPF